LRAKELCELIDEPFKDAGEAEPVDADADEPSTLKTATPAHVIEMIVMHHIVCSLYALLGEPMSEFRGSVREGEHMYDDCSESRFLVGWNEHGVVGFAFHKYLGSEESDTPPEQRDPMRHVPGIPEELRALATRLSNRADRWWTAGFYLTKGARRIEPGISADGSEHFKILVGPARAALFQRPGRWAALRSITPDQGELARTLAKRAMAGGGRFTDEEIAIALGTGPEMDQPAQPWLKEKNVARAAAEFAKLGLTLAVPADVLERARAARRAIIEARIAEALTPDERALLEAAHANDANTVRQLLARGVSPNVGYVADMFEDFPAFEGMPALMVALRSHAHDAALALIDGGADVSWQLRGGRLTAFTSAVSAGDVDIARRLVEGLTNKSEEIAAALWSAALRGERAMVDFLLESGAARVPHPRAALRFQQLRDRGQAEIADLLERVIADATPKKG
jgi:hypothetical protein